MSSAFDSNVLINAVSSQEFGSASIRVLSREPDRIGSVVLIPEVLTKPLRVRDQGQFDRLNRLLSSFELKPVDEEVADASVTLGAKYGLKAADAIHLATAVVWGAERFYTHNTKDFSEHITEIDVLVPA